MKFLTSDHSNLLSGITPGRLVNAMKVFGSYHYSRLKAVPAIKGLPISVSIEPTTSCNLRCPECPSGLRSFSRPTGMLQSSLFTKVIDELSETLIWLTFYFQGEPYLNRGFMDMVAYASSKGIYTSTSTNGHYLDSQSAEATVKSGLDRLIISIDGVSQKSYESYRVGGDLSKVIEGTKNIVAWKKKLKSKTPHLVFQFLVVRPNEHEVPLVYSLADELGVDQVVLKTAQIYNYTQGSELIPDNDKYSRYRLQQDGTYQIKNKLLNQCWKMWNSCVITWDGKVVPCCFDKDAHHVLGDVTKKSFQEIWTSEEYNSFRSALLKSRSEIDICKNCTEGTKVWA